MPNSEHGWPLCLLVVAVPFQSEGISIKNKAFGFFSKSDICIQFLVLKHAKPADTGYLETVHFGHNIIWERF